MKRVLGTIFAVSIILAASGTAMAAGKPIVTFKTNMGDFTVQLEPERAPKTVANFLEYVRDGHYDGTIFHRVIAKFMVQGGGMDATLKKKKTIRPPVELEVNRGLSNLRGTVAMARTSNPNSATSQFFVNVVDNKRLDSTGGGYAVFGKVISGMEVVDAIRAMPTTKKNGMRDVPVETVSIVSAKRVK